MSVPSLRLSRCALVATALLLAGCGATSPSGVAICPKLSLLKDAADLTRFTGSPDAPHDARSLALTASISAVPARCGETKAGKVRARLNVVAQVHRGPAFQGDIVRVPYFIAITEGGKVITEQDFALAVKFPSNVDQANVTGQDIDLTLPVSKTKTAAVYHIYVGFRLTPEELAYNRKEAGSE